MIYFDNNKISLRQLQALLLLDLLGTAVITLPRRTADVAGVDGWAGVMVGGILLLGVLWMFTALLAKTPRITVVELCMSHFGRPAGILLSLGLGIKLLLTSGLELRIFCEMINQTMLFRTPVWITAGAMALVCVCVAAGGYECRARAAEILFVLVILPLLFFLTIAAFSVDYSQLQPVFHAGARPIGRAGVVTLFSFQGIEALLLVYPYLSEPDKARKSLFSAGLLLLGITTAITILTIAWFGDITVKSKLFPVLQMLDSIDVPGAFWNRQDIFMLWFWTVSVFASVSAGLFFASIIMVRIVKKASAYNGKWLLLGLIPLYLTAILPGSAASATAYMEVVKKIGGGFYILLLPAILLLLSRAKGGRKNEG